MAKFKLISDNEQDVRFDGVLVAEVNSRRVDGAGQSRWTELSLYRTKGGSFVCHEVRRTQWIAESDSFKAAVVDDAAGVLMCFGLGDLAKELYAAAGIDSARDVA